jgi:hypothetical protein
MHHLKKYLLIILFPCLNCNGQTLKYNELRKDSIKVKMPTIIDNSKNGQTLVVEISENNFYYYHGDESDKKNIIKNETELIKHLTNYKNKFPLAQFAIKSKSGVKGIKKMIELMDICEIKVYYILED